MTNRDAREALLRGAEGEPFDLLSEPLASKQWAELLKAPLERAVATGNTGLAQKLVGAGAEIGNALHEAVRSGHGTIVTNLLECGAPPAAKDADGTTPLHLAARRGGKLEILQMLILKGADIDALDGSERSPLYLAVGDGHAAAALALLVAGADVTLFCTSSKKLVIHAAAQRGHVEILRALIEHGADLDAGDESRFTALHDAALENDVGAIDILADAGANIEAHGGALYYTPLHIAANWGNLAVVLVLLQYGADVNALDNVRETPLHYATECPWTERVVEVVDCLLRAGADETLLDDDGDTAMDYTVNAVLRGDDIAVENAKRVRQLLVNAPADRAWRRQGYLVMCRAHPEQVAADAGQQR